MKTYKEEDLEKLGFSFNSETKTFCYPSKNLHLQGNIEVNTNLYFGKNFTCDGHVLARKITAKCDITINKYLSCEKVSSSSLSVGEKLYVSRKIFCSYELNVNEGLNSGDITSKFITVHGSIEALNISAEKLTIYGDISCKSLVSK